MSKGFFQGHDQLDGVSRESAPKIVLENFDFGLTSAGVDAELIQRIERALSSKITHFCDIEPMSEKAASYGSPRPWPI